MSLPPYFEAALNRARQPSAVVVANHHCDPPKLVQHMNSQLDGTGALKVLEYVLKANALRDQMQRQVARAVSVLACPENLNWSRLAGAAPGAVPRKPRIMLWAEFNGRGTLEIFAFPELDPGKFTECFTSKMLAERSDYVEMPPLWPGYGARNNVVFRVLEDDYVDCERRDNVRVSRRDGQEILREALESSLSYLVKTLASVCEVCIGNWPTYSESGKLDLLSPAERASLEVTRRWAELKQDRINLEAVILEKVHRHKLASIVEFEELVAQAARDSVKVTALIFAKTGQRCSSVGTNKISELLTEYRELVAYLDQFDGALLELRRQPVFE